MKPIPDKSGADKREATAPSDHCESVSISSVRTEYDDSVCPSVSSLHVTVVTIESAESH